MLEDVVEIRDDLRKPINADEREKRPGDIPYFGATGQVGWIDDYLMDGEYVLLGEDGAPFLDADKSKAYIVKGKAWVNNHAHVLKGKDGVLGNRYLLHALNDVDFSGFVNGTTRLKLTQGSMRAIPLRVAPLEEQHRIVAKIEELFSDIDAGVSALERVRANLKRYRASVLKAATEGKLTEDWRAQHPDTEPAAVLLERILTERRRQWEKDQLAKFAQAGKRPPSGWQGGYRSPALPLAVGEQVSPPSWTKATLDQLTHFITSGSRGWAKYYADDGASFIRAQDINTDRLRLDDVARVSAPDGAEGERTRVRCQDLLVTITGANVTRSAIVDIYLDDAYVSQHVALARPVLTGYMKYVFYCVICPAHGRLVLERQAYGAGKPGLNLDHLRNLTVSLPPLSEQMLIVAEVERRLSIIDGIGAQVDANLKRAFRLRQGILKRAFEGRLVPQEPQDEHAAKLLDRIRQQRHATTAADNSAPRTRLRGRRSGGCSTLPMFPEGDDAKL
jgi:type I restriction enzyme S subunit